MFLVDLQVTDHVINFPCKCNACHLKYTNFITLFIDPLHQISGCGCLICKYILQKRTLCCQNHIMCLDSYLIITGKSNIPILFCSSETYH